MKSLTLKRLRALKSIQEKKCPKRNDLIYPRDPYNGVKTIVEILLGSTSY